ncbi:MAG: hypothetical protein R2712_25565 [Vicinamibacterales bacterium]
MTALELVSAARSAPEPHKLIVVANRGPCIHLTPSRPARTGVLALVRLAPPEQTGLDAAGQRLLTALDPVMRACGGPGSPMAAAATIQRGFGRAWTCRGAARQPVYTLRRVWLTAEEEEGYYYGGSRTTRSGPSVTSPTPVRSSTTGTGSNARR